MKNRMRETEEEYRQRPAYLDGAKVGTEDKAAGNREIGMRLGRVEFTAFIEARGFGGSDDDVRAWEAGYGRAFYPRPATDARSIRAVSDETDEPSTTLENVLDRLYADPAGEDE